MTHVLAYLSIGWQLPLCSHDLYCIPTTSTNPCHQPPLTQLVPIPYATSFLPSPVPTTSFRSPLPHPLPSPPCHICFNPDGLYHLLHTAATPSASSIPPTSLHHPLLPVAIWPTQTEHAYSPPVPPPTLLLLTTFASVHHLCWAPPFPPYSHHLPQPLHLFNVPTFTAWLSSPFCSQQLSPASSSGLPCIPYNLSQHMVFLPPLET